MVKKKQGYLYYKEESLCHSFFTRKSKWMGLFAESHFIEFTVAERVWLATSDNSPIMKICRSIMITPTTHPLKDKVLIMKTKPSMPAKTKRMQSVPVVHCFVVTRYLTWVWHSPQNWSEGSRDLCEVTFLVRWDQNLNPVVR